jgi:hypothetical protein
MKITLIDPKNGFGNLPAFEHIDLASVSLDMKSPSNTSPSSFIFQFLPILACICSLIYGLDLVNQAADIAISQQQLYIQQTGVQTALCLRDIYEALHLIKVSNFRLVGYLDADKTAFSLVLGKQNLFSCRKGLSLEWLFSHNTVINAKSLTSEFQCKAFINFFLYWLQQRAKDLPESKVIKHVIVIDDALHFIGNSNRFASQQNVSQLGHTLAVLRSAGICCIFVSQLAASIDPSAVSLCRNMLVIGNINGEENLRVIQNFMSLTPKQKTAILRFKTREMLAFVSGSAWPYPVHGWAPHVDDLSTENIPPKDLTGMIVPWHSLTDISRKEKDETQAPIVKTDHRSTIEHRSTVDTLVFDCITYPCDKASAHAKRMKSIREYDTAKTEATQNGYLVASQCGKTLYLIPTDKAYDKFSQPCPFKRTTSMEHGFYVYLAAHLLKKDSNLSKVRMETPIGAKGATIDVTTTDMAGVMMAYEVTLSLSNLLSNAARLQGTAYTKIVWLCRDAATAKAVQACFNKSSALPNDLLTKFEYIHFSKFARQYDKGGK